MYYAFNVWPVNETERHRNVVWSPAKDVDPGMYPTCLTEGITFEYNHFIHDTAWTDAKTKIQASGVTVKMVLHLSHTSWHL